MMGDDNREDISWYICNLCNQAFNSVGRLRTHNRLVHHSSSSSKGSVLVNVWILSQAVDLQPVVKVKKLSEASISCGSRTCSTFGNDFNSGSASDSSDGDSSSIQGSDWALSDESGEAGSSASEGDGSQAHLKVGINLEVKEEQISAPTLKFRRVEATGGSPARFGCTFCNKHYGDRRDLRSHLKNVHNPTQEIREGRTCPICQKEFSRRSDMLNHQQNRNAHVYKRKRVMAAAESGARLCPICGFQAKSTSGMRNHQSRTHGPTAKRPASFDCEICGKPCRDSASLKRHKFTHLAPGSGNLICEECGARFYTIERLRKHCKRTHDTFGGYKCDECGRAFTDKEKLQQHASVHLDPSFTCSECQKAYKTRSRLRTHVRSIHSTKSHICRICGRAFRKKSSVLFHEMQVHNFQREGAEGIEGKKFECLQCKKLFLSSHNLKQHEARHRNERLHLCETCGKRFKLKNQLDHHLKVSHRPNEELPHPCELCGKRFGWLSHVATHKRIVHGQTKGSCQTN